MFTAVGEGARSRVLLAGASAIAVMIMHGLVAMSPASAQSCGDFPHVHQIVVGSDSVSAGNVESEARVLASMGVAEIPTPGETSGGAICLAILLASFVIILVARPFSFRARGFRLERLAASPSMRDRAPPSVCLSELCVWRT
ncbi:MAG: hypothetical protein EXQ60_06375 [Candidatus Nanopelagicales bacterium]|nr:hypothetical protein [Candidatus Nanopelagicales bacterium]